MNSSWLWRLHDVSVSGDGPTSRLTNITLEVKPGVTAVIGPSGAGKTSLLNLLVQFERPSTGSIEFSLNPRSRPLFWVPQTAGLWPFVTPVDHLSWVSPQPGDIDQHRSLLDQFGLAARADAKPATLSEGEASRLAVARALASQASVLVMDEPLVNVEPSALPDYWEIIREHCRQGNTSLVFSSHSAESVLREADQVICLTHGAVVYAGDVTRLYYEPSNREQAEFLGPHNWFDGPSDFSEWFGDSSASARCLRPEQIHIQPSEQGTLSVRQVRFAGAYQELEVTNVSTGNHRRLYHRPSAASIKLGDRVELIRIE